MFGSKKRVIKKLSEAHETLQREYQSLKEAHELLVEARVKVADNRKKLSKDQVCDIRVLHQAGEHSQRELAALFQINPATVSRIVRGIYH